MQILAGVFPSSVKVHSENGGSIVSVDDTVGVEHGYHLKDKFFPELVGFRSV